MARLDVYEMRRGVYVLDVQAPLLEYLKTRVVVPLLPEGKATPPIMGLNPVFEVRGVRHVLVTQALAAVQVSELGQPVCSLDGHHDEIARAMDFLVTGF